MEALGRHILLELYECSKEKLNDVSFIEDVMCRASQEAGATLINSTFHHFSPYGVSGVIVIQESHLSIHTWPEFKYAAVDIFSCGASIDPWKAYDLMLKQLETGYSSIMEISRGHSRLISHNNEFVPGETLKSFKPETGFSRSIWFTERTDNYALSLRHTGTILFKEKSPFQLIEIYETYEYGKMLVLDGHIMFTQKDEFAYHEMLTHPPLLTHPDPADVLVFGGGDGHSLREIIRHKNVRKIVLVEIDPVVIAACKEHFPGIKEAFNDPRINLVVSDGNDYITKCQEEHFDVVIIDSVDPVQPSLSQYTEEFFFNIHRILKNDGIMICQSESPFFHTQFFQKIFSVEKKVFGSSNVHCCLAYVPAYPSGMWSFSFCSKGSVHPVTSMDSKQISGFSSQHPLQYYCEDVHRSAFCLPPFVRKLLE